MRAALNQAFGLVLQGETGRVRLSPTFDEHKDLMAGLPQGLSRQYRSAINRFLCHLEQQGRSWSDLVPANSGMRPAALERVVNEGILEHGLQRNTRAALNQAFGLVLQGETGRVRLSPTFDEHKDLMASLSPDLAHQYRSNVSRFLCHLERQGRSWSDLVPANSGMRPAALEQAVNESIRDHGLQGSTRAALNRTFGLDLQGESGRPTSLI
ncbi:hypothetical protein CFB39_38285 [Burkholderia sp. AU6039]|nr:hypothetical protein CFB39_38285 [Burkholderia sp. AU6039]